MNPVLVLPVPEVRQDHHHSDENGDRHKQYSRHLGQMSSCALPFGRWPQCRIVLQRRCRAKTLVILPFLLAGKRPKAGESVPCVWEVSLAMRVIQVGSEECQCPQKHVPRLRGDMKWSVVRVVVEGVQHFSNRDNRRVLGLFAPSVRGHSLGEGVAVDPALHIAGQSIGQSISRVLVDHGAVTESTFRASAQQERDEAG